MVTKAIVQSLISGATLHAADRRMCGREDINLMGGRFMDGFQDVTVVKKANVYYNGNVTSGTIFLKDGARKALGIILPGQYEFGTEGKEHMEVLAGELHVLLPSAGTWESFKAGQSFEIPANSKFTVAAEEVSDYYGSYIGD